MILYSQHPLSSIGVEPMNRPCPRKKSSTFNAMCRFQTRLRCGKTANKVGRSTAVGCVWTTRSQPQAAQNMIHFCCTRRTLALETRSLRLAPSAAGERSRSVVISTFSASRETLPCNRHLLCKIHYTAMRQKTGKKRECGLRGFGARIRGISCVCACFLKIYRGGKGVRLQGKQWGRCSASFQNSRETRCCCCCCVSSLDAARAGGIMPLETSTCRHH